MIGRLHERERDLGVIAGALDESNCRITSETTIQPIPATSDSHQSPVMMRAASRRGAGRACSAT